MWHPEREVVPIQVGQIGFVDFSCGEKLLHNYVGGVAEGGYDQAGGVLVETVGHSDFPVRSIFIHEPLLNRDFLAFSRHGEHSGRFVDDAKPLVFKDYDRLMRGRGDHRAVEWWSDVQTAKHPLQQRSAFATACGVVLPMNTQFALLRFAIPVFGHSHRLPSAPVSRLQQFRGTAFAGS